MKKMKKMKKIASVLCSLWVLLLAPACAAEPPREPDPRDISPSQVAYVLLSMESSPTVAVEDRELVAELTGSVNGLRSELGTYEEDSHYPEPDSFGVMTRGTPYEGKVTFYDDTGALLAHVAYYDHKVYRDHYAYSAQRSILFDRKRLERLCEDRPEGVAPVAGLYYECMWGADTFWIEDGEKRTLEEISDRKRLERTFDYFAGITLREDEPCGEEEPWRFRLRWTYLEAQEVLEEVKVGEDGRVQRNGTWYTPLNRRVDQAALERLTR